MSLRLFFYFCFLVFPALLHAQEQAVRRPGGVAAIFKEGKPIYVKANGYADIKAGIPNALSTRFYFGSDGKKFTAFAILLLEQQGKLKLSENIRKYLPELPLYADQITIDHLLYQTSGIRDYLSLIGIMCRTEDKSFDKPEKIYQLITAQSKLNFKPGSANAYSNSNYFLLALIVERIAGVPFHQFIQEHILNPAGMSETHFHFMKGTPQTASGYSRARSSYKMDKERFAPHKGDGGIVSSVVDMDKFYRFLFSDQNKSILSKMTEPVLVKGAISEYRRGIKYDQINGVDIWYHGGGFASFTSQMIYVPSLRTSVITAVNYSGIVALSIAYQLADSIIRNDQPTCNTLKLHTGLSAFAGWYIDSLLSDYRVLSYSDSVLSLSGSIKLEPLGDQRFMSSCVPYIEYKLDSVTGNMTRVTGNSVMHYKKILSSEFQNDLEGKYFCDDIQTKAEIDFEKGKPVFYFKRNYIARVSYSFKEGCIIEAFDAVIRFGVNESGEKGFWLSNERSMGLWFKRRE